MFLQNPNQSANTPRKLIIQKVLTSPWIRILKKIGFLPKGREDQAISEVVLFTLFIGLLTCFTGYQLGMRTEVPKGWEMLISLAFMLCGYDMVKEFIGSTLQAVSIQGFENRKAEGLKMLDQEMEKIHKHYEGKIDMSIQEQRHRYYLTRIVGGISSLTISDLKFEHISPLICQEMHRLGTNYFQKELEEQFEEIKKSRSTRCIVQGLPDKEFLQPVALIASRHALGGKSNEEMNHQPEYYLFRDIYAYLKAWVICSLDNDNGDLMPINPIGLNYPSRNNPNKVSYTVALSYIKSDLLEREESKNFLPEPARQSVKDCIDKLINLIEEYENKD